MKKLLIILTLLSAYNASGQFNLGVIFLGGGSVTVSPLKGISPIVELGYLDKEAYVGAGVSYNRVQGRFFIQPQVMATYEIQRDMWTWINIGAVVGYHIIEKFYIGMGINSLNGLSLQLIVR